MCDQQAGRNVYCQGGGGGDGVVLEAHAVFFAQ